MATVRLPDAPPADRLPDGTPLMSLEEAMQVLSRDERFMATVYALRTLLVGEGDSVARGTGFPLPPVGPETQAERKLGFPPFRVLGELIQSEPTKRGEQKPAKSEGQQAGT